MPRWFRRRTVAEPTARHRAVGSATPAPRDYTITVSLGGFGHMDMRWSGTSREDVAAAFTEYIYNDREFGHDPDYPFLRRLHVRFNGRHMLLLFRTDWVAGFTVR